MTTQNLPVKDDTMNHYRQRPYTPPLSGNRSRGSSAASRYTPNEYQTSAFAPQNFNSHLAPPPRSGLVAMPDPGAFTPPVPEQYQARPYSPSVAINDLQASRPESLGGYARRLSEDRPRLSTDSRHSESARSHRSHHSSRGHHSHAGHEHGHEHEHHHGDHHHGDRHQRHRHFDRDAEMASQRSGRSHHHDRDDDSQRLERTDTRRPTLGGSLLSLWQSIKKAIE